DQNVFVYRSFVPAIDEGWTRWVFEHNALKSEGSNYLNFRSQSITNPQILSPTFLSADHIPKVIVFPDQPPAQILNGYAKGAMPDEYTGGVGKEGVENLRKFVE